MVKSTKSNVIYPEKRNIEVADDKRVVRAISAPVKIGLYTDTILITFGGILNSTDEKYKYSPIYLTNNEHIIQRIGCYEFNIEDKDLVIDSNGDMILENLQNKGEFLIFHSLINRELIELYSYKNQMPLSVIKEEQEEGEIYIDILDSPSVSPVKSNEPELYTEDVVFTFYAKSADVKPGKGVYEKIPNDLINNFKTLQTFKNWRRVLSNFYVNMSENEIVIPLFKTEEDNQWASVEHYFQAQKFKNYPDYYKLFTLNSESEISKSVKLAKEVGEKGKLKNKIFVPKHILKDSHYLDTSKYENYVEKGQFYKYSQHKLSKQILLATKNAKLQHLVISREKDQKPIVFYDTMRIRQKIKD